VGGFAAQVAGRLRRAQAVGKVRLHAVCEPDHVTHAAAIETLRRDGVVVHDSYDALLREPIDAVWLPVPIYLHRAFTEQALAAGKVVICEKPAAGCVDDVDAMIAARDTANGRVAVGFDHLYLQSTCDLKRRLVDGEIGRVSRVTVMGCWPRGKAYYARAGWAGGLKREGAWVLDSPANNAMAHPLHLALFLMGRTLRESAEPLVLDAELYRVNPIENYDTCALRIVTGDGVSILVLLTHACGSTIGPRIVLHGSRGMASWSYNDTDTFMIDGVPYAYRLPAEIDNRQIDWLTQWMSGELNDGLVATLENARAHAVVVSGASQASPIHTIDDSHIVSGGSADDPVLQISNIEKIFGDCVMQFQLPGESGKVPWAKPASRIDLRGYQYFEGPAQ
jgi:predicted dehydrogenase